MIDDDGDFLDDEYTRLPPVKDEMRSISIVMASFLGRFRNAASNRKQKFMRAVESFQKQTFEGDKELIIVADGCEDTKNIYKSFYADNPEIKLLSMPKQTTFSGLIRDKGLRAASYNFVAYLDTDDYFSLTHLDSLVNQMMSLEKDWVYYSDWIKVNKRDTQLRNVTLTEGSAGTSSICHKRSLPVSWAGLDGYGHDWKFIKQLIAASKNYTQIHGCGYTVCHTVNGFDF